MTIREQLSRRPGTDQRKNFPGRMSEEYPDPHAILSIRNCFNVCFYESVLSFW